MKCAIVIADGIKQIMFTPENKNEKMALEMIRMDDNITVERKTGRFYDRYEDDNYQNVRGYNVALCQGGYLRAYDDSDSLMLVLKPKKDRESD